jgi:hypothetical protein
MTTQQVTESAIKIAERFGVPFLILLALMFMIREAAVGLHATVVVPIVKSHTEFLHGTRETLREISNTQSQQAEALREIAVAQIELRRAILSDSRTQTVK